MKTDLKSNREYIARRGHMLSFLLGAFAASAWINVFQEQVNADILAFLSNLG